MEKIPGITDITARFSDHEKNLQELSADPGAAILTMKPTKRMAEFTKQAAIQDRVIRRVLERSLEEYNLPKKPHLTVIK
jgi:hypothetical protein